MALDEKKKKVVYNADGTTNEEKDDRSVKGSVLPGAVSPTQVAGTPQVQNVGQVNVAPPAQKVQTIQESQGGVNPPVAEKKGEVVAAPAVGAVSNENDVAQITPVVTEDTVAPGSVVPGQSSEETPSTVVENPNFVNGSDGSVSDEAYTQNNAPVNESKPAEVANATAFMNDPAQKSAFESEIKSWGVNGNVDHMNRRVVSGRDLKAKKWGLDKDGKDLGQIADDSSATLFSVRYGDKKNNILLTPILADGTVMEPEQLDAYKDQLIRLSGGDLAKMLEIDKKWAKILVGTNVPEGIEEKMHLAHEKYYLNGGKDVPAANGNVSGGSDTGQSGKANTGASTNTSTAANTGTSTNTGTAANTGTSANAGAQGSASSKITPEIEAATKKAFGEYNDAFLANIILANRGRDSEEARAAVRIAGELLKERGKELPPETATVDTKPSETGSTDTPAETKKTAPVLTEQEKKDKEDAKAALQKYSGHVDLSDRHLVSEKDMHDAGWNAVGDQSVYPQLEKIKDKDGNVHKVLMTPIYADGTVMPQETYKEFVKNLDRFSDPEELMSRDTHGIIIKIDADDADADELDDLTKKALKGELVKDIDSDLEEEYKPENSAARNQYVKAQQVYEKKVAEIREQLKNPDISIPSIALKEAKDSLKGIDDDIEKTKKRQRTSSIIANIGDILQGFANLAGVWYGANNSALSSLSAASRASQERELTKLEKRRDEIMKNIASIKDDLIKNKNTELSEWIKQLNETTKAIHKFDADAEKAFREAKLKRKEKRAETVEQNQRRSLEYVEKRNLEQLKSDLRMKEDDKKTANRIIVKQTAPGKAASSSNSKKRKKSGKRRGNTPIKGF